MEEKNWICLIRIETAEGARSHLIAKSSFTLGRTQESDVPLLDKGVSRIHVMVEIKDHEVWLTDQKSANGTLVNDRKLEPNVPVKIEDGDTVRLGTMVEPLRFTCIPRPVELMSDQAKKDYLVKTMGALAREFEAKTREDMERELRQARAEAQQLQSQAQRDAETLKTEALLEMKTRQQALDAEIAKLRQEAQVAATEERLRARREADLIVAEAHKKIQKDFDSNAERIDEHLKSSHAEGLRLLEEAETKARAVTNDARAEAARLRADASEEARHIQQDTLKKTSEALAGLKEKLQKEAEERRIELFNQVQRDAEVERERATAEHTAFKMSLGLSVKAQIDQSEGLKAEIVVLTNKIGNAREELEKLRSENVELQALIGHTEELERRRDKAQHELHEFTATRHEGLSKIDREFRELRERNIADFEEQKKKQESEHVRERLKAMEEVKKSINAEEQRYDQAKKLRAVELTQRLCEALIPSLDVWVKAPSTASARMQKDIEAAVGIAILGGGSSVQAPVFVTAKEIEKSREKTLKAIAVGLAAALILLVIFARPIVRYLEGNQGQSYASKMIEKRKLESLFIPKQSPEFRSSYTENVLYMSGYFETKSDPDYTEKWTLKLNDLKLVRSFGLGEEDVVRFIAKETNLVQRLGTLRSSIDAHYLNEGLDRMRKAEEEGIKELAQELKGEANLKKIHELEKSFLTDYMAQHKKSAPPHALSDGG